MESIIPLRQKHELLLDSLNNIQTVKTRIKSLLDRIRGDDVPEVESSVKDKGFKPVSLLGALEESPKTIDSQCAEINDLLTAIDECLF